MPIRPPEPAPEPAPGAWVPGGPGSAAGQAYGCEEPWEEPWWEPPEHQPSDAELAGAWPDPNAGPPDLQMWLSWQDQADGEAEEVTPGGDIRAGSFADGGPAEAMTPDAVLAALSQDAMLAGLGRLDDDELVGVLRAARRLESWQAGVELAVVAELDARRKAQAGRPGWSRVSEHVSAELAAALALTGRSADELLGLARGLDRLPVVLAALLAGRIDRARVMVFAAELAQLGDLAAAAVAAALTDVAGSMTTGQLRAALRQMVLLIDPEAVRRRAQAGRADARVERWSEGSGNAALAGRELPPAEVIAADARLTAIARSLQTAGAPGTLDQLRAAVYTALLTGRDLETLIHAPATTPRPADPGGASGPGDAIATDGDAGGCGSDGGAGEPGGAGGTSSDESGADDSGAGGSSADGSAADGGAGDGADRAATARPGSLAALTGSVHLIMPVSAWLGQTDAPGEVTGYGPLDVDTCRDLAARLSAGPGTRWCLTLTSPDGRAAAHACARHGPEPPGSPGPPGPPGTPSAPGRPGMPRSARPPAPAAPGSLMSSRSPGSASHAGRDQLPATAGLARWLTTLPMAWLESGACGHTRQAAGYRPGPLLTHLITIRQRTCSYPGCRRPARRCDQDHTVPHDQGGRTCECNLAALCRAHHRAKQAPGWRVAQPQPGTLIWTTPHGRTYTTTPQPYPA